MAQESAGGVVPLGSAAVGMTDWGPSNKRFKLTAPLGGRSGNVGAEAAASRSPFGERRRRSLSAVLGRHRAWLT